MSSRLLEEGCRSEVYRVYFWRDEAGSREAPILSIST